MIPESTVSRVRESTDIVELIGSFIPLKRDGTGFKGCCPFHKEKSGSFNVNPAKQFFKCFGCGASGDAIRFVQEFKHIGFADAVKEMAAKKGIPVEENARPRRLDPSEFTYADPEAAEAGKAIIKEKIEQQEQPRRRRRSEAAASPSEPFDWEPCVAAFTPEHAAKLAEWRGLSPEFVLWLHREKLVGIHRGSFAIPVHDKAGTVVRCHYRLEDGRWMYFPKGDETAPLVIGDPADAGSVLAFESQWDGFAVLDQLGYHEDPSAYAAIITRGATSNTDFSGYVVPTITCVPQNDPEEKRNKKTGHTPAEDWLAKIRDTRSSSTRVLVGRVPAKWKDANDWIRDGKATAAEVRKAVVESARSPLLTEYRSLGDLLKSPAKDDPNALIGYRKRWLCRGSSFIFCGPSGIGKSTLTTSMAVHWAAGASWHGIAVRRPLKTVVIQAENDHGDIEEMAAGALKSMKGSLSEAELRQAQKNLGFIRQCEKIGESFCRWLEEVIRETGAEVVCIDPLLSYVGGDVSKQEVASQFLRSWLQPVLARTGCIALIVHHTGKTSSDAKARSHWAESDYSYIGIGSSEITNWPRAMAAILPIPGHDGKFKLMLTKRGSRAGMRSKFSQDPATSIFLAHSSEGLGWVEIEAPDEGTQERRQGGRKAKLGTSDVLKAIGSAATMVRRDKLTTDLSERHDVSDRTVRGIIQMLLDSERVHVAETQKRPGGGREIEWLRAGPPTIGKNHSEISDCPIPDRNPEGGKAIGKNPI